VWVLLAASCVQWLQVPEIAFTGDTSGELFEKDGYPDLYRAKLLIVECTFVDDSVTWEQVGRHTEDNSFYKVCIVIANWQPGDSVQQILGQHLELLPAICSGRTVQILGHAASHSAAGETGRWALELAHKSTTCP
jgi:hypothetical protein